MEEVNSPKGQGEREGEGAAGGRGRDIVTGLKAESLRGTQAGVGDGRLGSRGTRVMQEEEEGGERTWCLPEMGTWGGRPRLWPS